MLTYPAVHMDFETQSSGGTSVAVGTQNQVPRDEPPREGFGVDLPVTRSIGSTSAATEPHAQVESPTSLDDLSDLFKLLSDRTRLKLIGLLADGELNVSALCERLALPQPTVSHHLGLLRMHQLVANRRDGKQIFYRLGERLEWRTDGLTVDHRAGTIAITLAQSAGE